MYKYLLSTMRHSIILLLKVSAQNFAVIFTISYPYQLLFFYNICTFFLPSPCRKLSSAFTRICHEWTFKHGISTPDMGHLSTHTFIDHVKESF